MKMLGALDNPKGISIYSYSPPLVLNAIFNSSHWRILIWWYPLLRSILENIVALDIKFNISSRRGMEKMILFNDFVDCTTIHTHTLCVILFWCQKCENRTWAQTFLWTLCQLTPLTAIIILRARQGSFCNGAGLAKLLLGLGQWHVECLLLEATHLADLWGGRQKTSSIGLMCHGIRDLVSSSVSRATSA